MQSVQVFGQGIILGASVRVVLDEINICIYRLSKVPYFAMYNALLCIIRTHVFGLNLQGKKSFVLIFKFNYVFIYI